WCVLANKIEKKLALGLLEISIYKHSSPGKLLADTLREHGYSVTTTVGYGIEGKERLVLTIILSRKHFPVFYRLIEQYGKVNMSVKSITKIYGKVGGINVTHKNNLHTPNSIFATHKRNIALKRPAKNNLKFE
ncbi:MAG: hypothetical protein WC364_13685, partial [Eubacteriales bacterium]